MIAAMVLCAGFGTRLRPLTDDLPKPLVPVGDRSLLAHVIDSLRRDGIERVVINTHHRASYFNAVSAGLQVIHEPKILGTAGGVAHAASALGAGDVLIWNGDILAPGLDLTALLARHGETASDGLWVVEPLVAGEGTVGLDAQGQVVRLRNERFGREASGGNYLGVQIMPAALRASLPAEGCLVADVALPLLRRGGKIASFAFAGRWDDVGEPGALLRANLGWLAVRGLRSWCAPDATVAPGVTLDRAIVGAGGSVTGQGAVRESVVFPGARLVAPCERQLVAVGSRVASVAG